jgi:hypothetical protein
MKTTMKSRIFLSIAALVLTVWFAIPAAAQHGVPFKGTFQGSDAVNPPTIITSGSGVGTHMGQFSFSQDNTLTSQTTGGGTAHWEAADGDSIDSTYTASADFSTHSLGYIAITEIHTVTGGTGRFMEAHGNFVMEYTHIVAPSSDGTHVIFGSFHGTITSPGTAN